MTPQNPNPTTILVCPLILLLTGLATLAQTPAVLPRLSGIVNLSDHKLAVLEVPADSPRQSHFLVLSEGQRDGPIEVMRILPDTRTVELHILPDTNAQVFALTNKARDAAAKSFAFVFENASLEPVLNLYSDFSQRTLLRWPELPHLSFSTVGSAGNPAAAALAIQSALNEKGLATIPDGEKFLMIVPQQKAPSVKPRSSDIRPSGPVESESLPPGAIDFRGLDIHQVLYVYAELCQRKLDRNVLVPPPIFNSIHFRTRTPLNRADAIYALDTLLGWAGLKMVPNGTDQLKPVPASEATENPAKR